MVKTAGESIVVPVSRASEKEAKRVSRSILKMLDKSKRTFGVPFESNDIAIALEPRSKTVVFVCLKVKACSETSVRMSLGTGNKLCTGGNIRQFSAAIVVLDELSRSKLSQSF